MIKLDLSDVTESSVKPNCVRIWHPEDQPYDFPFGDCPNKDRKCLWVIESPKDFGGFPGTEYLFYSGLDGDTDKLEMEDSTIYFVYDRQYGKSVCGDACPFEPSIDLSGISNECDDECDMTCNCSQCGY